MSKKFIEGNNYNPDIYRNDINQWTEGEYTVTRSTHWSAPGCHDGCGLIYYTKEGKLVKVEGDPANGYSRGALCMRCLDLTEAVYAENRLKYPMTRNRSERGKDTWRRISWEETFDLIEAKVREFQKKYTASSVVVTQGTGRNTVFYHSTVLTYLGFQSPSAMGGFLSGDSCYSPRSSIMALMAGCFLISDMSQTLEQRYDSKDWAVPGCILVWGNDPLVSNGDGYLGHWVVEAMKRGSELVVIDPRLNWLAGKAKYWLPVRPGTDGALAMAIAGVIIKEELYDKKFIDLWTYGFEEYAAAVQVMTPEKAAEICWLDADLIRDAARFIATAKPMALQWGLKFDQQVDGTPLGQTALGIVAMTGNIDVPGGSLLMVDHAFHLAMSNQDYWKFVPVEEHRNVMGINRFPMRNTGMQGNMGQTDVFLEALESNGEISDCETKFPIKMIVFYSNNVIANMAAEAPRILQALDNTEFNISVDPFMTPTAMASCELVVPIAMSCERNSLRAWWWPLRSISKVVDRYFETKTDEEFCAELTKRLNPDSPVPETDIGWMNQILSNSDIDITFEELEKKVIVWPEWKYKKYETGDVRYDGLPGFNTVTGRFEFTPVLFGQIGLPKAPYYTEPPESPTSTPDLYSEYPLILMTGRRSWEFFHSENRNQATMREFHPDPIIEISPELAAEQDFNEGDWVWIENQRGRCRQRVRITAGLRKDYVMAEHGWWYPEADPERLYETFDMNINNLTSQCDCGASGYGAPYNGLLCRVYKCSEENSKVMPTDQILKLGGWDYVRKHIDFSGLAVMQTAKPEHGAADNTVVGDTATLIGGWDK